MRKAFQPGIVEKRQAVICYLGDVPVVECDDAEFLTRWVKAVEDCVKHASAIKAFDEGVFPSKKFYSRNAQRCSYCLEWTDTPHLDHIVPRAEGGCDSPDNLVPACRSCNSRKHAKSLLQFVADGGLLPMEVAS